MSSISPPTQEEIIQYGEEPFELDLLPEKLVSSVFEKSYYREYARLRQTSKSMNDFANSHSFSLKCRFFFCEVTQDGLILLQALPMRFPKKIVWKDLDPTAWISVAIASINCPLSSQKVAELIELAKNNTVIESIKIYNDVPCKPEELELLLKVTKCTFLVCTHFLGAEYFTPQVMKLEMEVISNFADEQLLQWRSNHLRFTNDSISAKAVNTLIKEWKTGQREIDEFVLKFESTKRRRNIETILDGLEANPIWTPECHELSEIGLIPLEDLVDMERIYCLWRPQNIEETRFLIISEEKISFSWMNFEKLFLLDFLNEEQKKLVLRE